MTCADFIDVLVVGAGPAGTAAAITAAGHGASVELVDKARFPREKVCGCCLNVAALEQLRALGMADVVTELLANTVRELWLRSGMRSVRLALSTGAAVSRATLDQALVREAQRRGVVFRDSTAATPAGAAPGSRRVVLRSAAEVRIVEARVVIAADGLSGRFLAAEPGMRMLTARRSRLGVGAVVEMRDGNYRPGTIHMAVDRGGYVGVVALGDGRLDVAGALDPRFLRECGSPDVAVARVLEGCGFSAIGRDVRFRGTSLLTRRRESVAGHRLLAVGDAAAYVEPFTGEGIAWALAGGCAAGRMAVEAARSNAWDTSHEAAWTLRHAALFQWPLRRSCAVSRALRSSAMVAAATGLLAILPALAQPLVLAIQGRSAMDPIRNSP